MEPALTEGSEEKKGKHPYGIERIPLEDAEYKSETPEHLQNKDVPGFPTTVLLVGSPGSGKTNLFGNLMLSPSLWNGFFDKIYLIGPTVKSDKMYKRIKVPEDQIVTEEDQVIPKLSEWIEKQNDDVKTNPKMAPKTLFIFEDITTYRNTVQTNPVFTKTFTTIRHHKSTALANIHKYKAMERTARCSCMHVLVWPVNRTEIAAIAADYATEDFDLADFQYICEYAWTPTTENAKPFLYINRYAKPTEKFRKCFTEIINVKAFDGIHKMKRQLKKRKLDRMLKENNGIDPFLQEPEKYEKEPEKKNTEALMTKPVEEPRVKKARDNVLAYLH